jgi:large-conductance mechanosensitive channel
VIGDRTHDHVRGRRAQGFPRFHHQGNVIDLAVAVVIGAAFIAVVNAIVEGLITPLIAAIFGEPDLNEWAPSPSTEPTSRSASS